MRISVCAEAAAENSAAMAATNEALVMRVISPPPVVETTCSARSTTCLRVQQRACAFKFARGLSRLQRDAAAVSRPRALLLDLEPCLDERHVRVVFALDDAREILGRSAREQT